VAGLARRGLGARAIRLTAAPACGSVQTERDDILRHRLAALVARAHAGGNAR
jgi:hypothetical protein